MSVCVVCIYACVEEDINHRHQPISNLVTMCQLYNTQILLSYNVPVGELLEGRGDDCPLADDTLPPDVDIG